MANIMEMENGTKVRHRKTGTTFLLGDYPNEDARILFNLKYCGQFDYINEQTQGDYEVVWQCKHCKHLDLEQKTSVGCLCTNTERKMNKTYRRSSSSLGADIPTSRLKMPTQNACKTGFEPKDEL